MLFFVVLLLLGALGPRLTLGRWLAMRLLMHLLHLRLWLTLHLLGLRLRLPLHLRGLERRLPMHLGLRLKRPLSHWLGLQRRLFHRLWLRGCLPLRL